jgi:hypothetical protein
MTMRKNARSKKAIRITKSTPYSYEWRAGRFTKVYIYKDTSVREVSATYYIN